MIRSTSRSSRGFDWGSRSNRRQLLNTSLARCEFPLWRLRRERPEGSSTERVCGLWVGWGLGTTTWPAKAVPVSAWKGPLAPKTTVGTDG